MITPPDAVAMAVEDEAQMPPPVPGVIVTELPVQTDMGPAGVSVVPGTTVMVCRPDAEHPPLVMV